MKSSWKIIAICGLIVMHQSNCTPIKDYQAFADEWIATFVKSESNKLLITPSELNILLNLAFFSYKRSACTLAAQDAALQAITTNWHVLQNVTQTRRNPAIPIPYPLELKAYGKQMQQAWKLQQEHQIIGKTYAMMLENILKTDPDTSDTLRTAIERLREQSRAALIEALSTVQEYIQSLIVSCQKNLSNKECNTASMHKRTAIIDYLLTLLPQLAATSFVTTDRISVQASEEGWRVLAEIERIHNIIWGAIEQRRANFYAIIYRTLYACAQTVPADASVFNVSFDYEGPIAPGKRDKQLPDPRTITFFAQ